MGCTDFATSSNMTTLVINGAATDIGDARTIADIVIRMNLAGKKIAVEKNGEIVSRSRYAATPIAAGDRLEIVGAVGGG
jgi:sulfur carrier protein